MAGRASDNNWACQAIEKEIKKGGDARKIAFALANTPQLIAAIQDGLDFQEGPPGLPGGLLRHEAVRDNIVEALQQMGSMPN